MQPTSPRAPPQTVETDNYAYSEPPQRPSQQQQQQQRFSRGPAFPSQQQQQQPQPAIPPSAAASAPSSASYLSQPQQQQQQRPSAVVNPANCDITTMDSTDRSRGSAQLRPQESLGGFAAQRNPRGRSPMMQQQQPQSQSLRQQQNRPSNLDDIMMMMSQQQQQQQQQQQHGAEASGGYNFQRVMDDHFEHYKRPPSRERSVDLTNLPSSLVEAKTVRSSRPPSRYYLYRQLIANPP